VHVTSNGRTTADVREEKLGNKKGINHIQWWTSDVEWNVANNSQNAGAILTQFLHTCKYLLV